MWRVLRVWIRESYPIRNNCIIWDSERNRIRESYKMCWLWIEREQKRIRSQSSVKQKTTAH
jgi:hypothetical protein